MAKWKRVFYTIEVIGWQSPEPGQMVKKQRHECDNELGKKFQIESLTLSQIEREHKRLTKKTTP